MATGLLALLDDITSILDDVSAMTKVAAGKTAGVLGDDLALNAQQVAEVRADRELPVVWAVAKGSALNKAILVPTALAISAFAPWLVTPLLMLGGAYLCFEGVEKLAHPWLHEAAPGPHAPPPSEDERAKVRAAVRTDFVLSAEIIVITLGTVAGRPLEFPIGGGAWTRFIDGIARVGGRARGVGSYKSASLRFGGQPRRLSLRIKNRGQPKGLSPRNLLRARGFVFFMQVPEFCGAHHGDAYGAAQ